MISYLSLTCMDGQLGFCCILSTQIAAYHASNSLKLVSKAYKIIQLDK